MAHPKNNHERMQLLQQQRAAHLANLRKMVGKAANDDPPPKKNNEQLLRAYAANAVFKQMWGVDHPNFAPPKEPEGPKSVFDDARSFYQRLEKKGFVCLGRGYYSYVMAKPGSDRVIKIGRSANADGWPDYVHWAAQEGYAGTFAPKVFSYKVIKGKQANFSVAIMERMDRTLSESYVEDYSDSAPPSASVAANDNALVADLFTRSAKRNHELSTTLLDLVVPRLGVFAKKLGERFKGAGLDLHGANMMLRKDGSFCVTDPIARYDFSANHKRLKAMDFVPLAA
jgi:hypothetical protein